MNQRIHRSSAVAAAGYFPQGRAFSPGAQPAVPPRASRLFRFDGCARP